MEWEICGWQTIEFVDYLLSILRFEIRFVFFLILGNGPCRRLSSGSSRSSLEERGIASANNLRMLALGQVNERV